MLLLGIDIGTSGTKAVVVDSERDGAILGRGALAYPLHTPQPFYAEQEPDDWWRAAVVSIREAVHESDVDARDIAGIGLSGQMQGAVFLDKSDRVVRRAMLWCDQRAAAEAAAVTDRIGQARIIEWTSNPVLMGSTASKIVWLRNHEPTNYQRVHHLLLPKDYVRLKLTGERATDVCDASATALFDVSNRTWSAQMLNSLEIPEQWLPDAHESVEITGRIRSEAAKLTGLAPDTPVVAGAGDDASSAVGCGAVSTGIVASSVGTSAVLMAVSDESVPDPKMRVDMFCHAVPNKWQIIGATLTAGASLRWFKDVFCEVESMQARHVGADVYDLLCREAANVVPGCEGLIFLPHLSGMRTPEPNPYTTGVFFGITLRHGKAHFLRSVLEGVAFALRDSVDIFHELNVPVKQVRSIGGGGQNQIWRQIQADVTGLPHSTVNATEGAAFGAALLAGVGVGAYSSVPEACAAVQTVDTCMPAQENGAIYGGNYHRYRTLLRTVYRPATRI